MNPSPPLAEAYERCRAAHGHQRWWPAETPFEICLGAILTQNTSWTNVERALARLRDAGALTADELHRLDDPTLIELLRPAGCPSVKARRVRAFLAVLMDECHGSLARLFAGDTGFVRDRLLRIPGIGPETADCMLLYAGGHGSFVIDAYTRRIFARHGWCHPKETYEGLQRLCEALLPPDTDLGPFDRWQDAHAQWVRIGKDHCRPGRPRCEGCPLRELLPPGGPLDSWPPRRRPRR